MGGFRPGRITRPGEPNLRVRSPVWSILPGMAIKKRGRGKRDAPPSPAGSTLVEGRPGGTAVGSTAAEGGATAAHGGSDAEPGGQSAAPEATQESGGRRRSIGDLGPLQLVRAAHPRQALLTALGLAVAAALAGRPTREAGLVFLTVLVGQVILGWHNDLVDRDRDARHDTAGKPIAQLRIDAGTVWFSLACGLLLLVPLSLSNGLVAGCTYLIAVALGLLGNLALRRGLLSWLPWAASFALYPAFLSYGGWGGGDTLAEPFGAPPEISMTVLAALLGVGVHVLRALPGLVADRADGYRSVPLRIALRTGATKLLVIASVYSALVLVALLVVGSSVGLAQ